MFLRHQKLLIVDWLTNLHRQSTKRLRGAAANGMSQSGAAFATSGWEPFYCHSQLRNSEAQWRASSTEYVPESLPTFLSYQRFYICSALLLCS